MKAIAIKKEMNHVIDVIELKVVCSILNEK